MGTSKALNDARSMLEPEGYRYQGVNGNGHFVFTHPSGAVQRLGTAMLTTRRGRANVLSQAKQGVRQMDTFSQRFIRYVLESYKVGAQDSKLVSMHLGRMTAGFAQKYPGVLPAAKSAPYMALTNNPDVAELVKPAPRGGKPEDAISVWKLKGALWGVSQTRSEESDGTSLDDQRGVQHVARVSGVVAEPAGAGGTEPEPEAAGDDPQPVEQPAPVGGRRSAAALGVTLPDSLVSQLQEALGGDLRAENDLLRSQLHEIRENAAHAMGVLRDITSNVEDALALNPRPAQRAKPQPGDPGYALGRLSLNRLECLREHRDELPDPVTEADVHRVLSANGFPLTTSAAGSVLWRLASNRVAFERVGQGKYRWTE